MNYLIIIGIIGLLILMHELGHFICAKLAGIPIAVFSIGFGSKIIRWKRKETEYCISLIPLGGYILPLVKDEKEFFQIQTGKRIIFSIGGPLANIFISLLFLFVLNVVTFGSSFNLMRPFFELADTFAKIAFSIPQLFTSPEKLSGIVGIVNIGGQFISSSFINAIRILISLSLNLAVFNLLPIPALDGGKIILYLLEKIHPKLLKIQMPMTIAGWLLIFGLMIYATFNDIAKIFA